MPDKAYALTRTASPTPLHRLPVRMVEPPYEDDHATDATSAGAPATRSVQGTLALAFPLPSGVPAIPATPVAIRAGASAHPGDGESAQQPDDGDSARSGTRSEPVHLTLVSSASDAESSTANAKRARRRSVRDIPVDDFGPQRTPRALLPAPTPWAGRLVQAIVEVIGGARPVAQLVRWTSTDVYDSVRRRSRYLAVADDGARRVGSIVRSVHVVEPADGVAEVCAVVQHGSRCRAVALRLEGVDGRWQCTALQLG